MRSTSLGQGGALAPSSLSASNCQVSRVGGDGVFLSSMDGVELIAFCPADGTTAQAARPDVIDVHAHALRLPQACARAYART